MPKNINKTKKNRTNFDLTTSRFLNLKILNYFNKI